MDFEFFRQAHMLKAGANDTYTMIYRGYTNETLLPNQNFGLYSVYSLTLYLEWNDAAPHRSASARMTHGAYHPHQHANMNPATEEAAYMSYAGWEQRGTS